MKLRTAIGTATTAAVLATSGVALAGAASNTGAPPSSTTATAAAPAKVGSATRVGKIRLRRLIRQGAVAVITKTIGIDRHTLRADLLAGQTIAQIATANQVDPQMVINALVTAATTKLNAAVQADKIKPARATNIEQKLPARVAELVNTWLPKRAKTTTT
jgi:hypothetical protein